MTSVPDAGNTSDMRPLAPSCKTSRLAGPLALLALAAPLVAGGCCGLGSDGQNTPAPTSSSEPAPAASLAAAPTTSVISDAVPPTPAPAAREIAGAAHVLIAWKGAERAPKTITRSKDDAKKRAQEALNKLKSDKATFEEIVKQYSDDDISKLANGAVGNFERNAMPPAFADATFGMEVGALSDIVETPQGFHIIKRTK